MSLDSLEFRGVPVIPIANESINGNYVDGDTASATEDTGTMQSGSRSCTMIQVDNDGKSRNKVSL